MKRTYRMSRGLLVAIAAMSLSSTGCGGPTAAGLVTIGAKPFTLEGLHDPNNERAQQAVLERLAKHPPAAGADVVAGVVDAGELVGLDLSTGKTWSFSHPLDTRPKVVGALVVASGGGEVFALDARSGEKRWSARIDGRLIGAGNDLGAAGGAPGVTAVTVSTTTGSTLMVFDGAGKLVLEKQTDQGLGAPAVAGGMVFVPWKALYVTAFEIDSGAQLATFITEVETTRVVAIGGALFAGQGRLVRMDAALPKARSGGAAIAIAPERLPPLSRRDVFLLPSHDKVIKDDALDQTVLAARPLSVGAAGFEADRIYGAYFKLAIGYGAHDGQVAWVVTGRSDITAAAATKDGVVLVDEAGGVRLVSAKSGTVVKTMSLGRALWSAEVAVDGLAIGDAAAALSLTAQIAEAVTLRDDEMAAGQLFLVQQLAAVADAEATRVLLDVADGARTALPLRDEARLAIATRATGADAMLTLLARHASFLRDERPPPVGPMATALAAMKETRATPLLVAQLLDPALPQRDLLDTAKAVAALAGADQTAALQRFVLLYRGSSGGNAAIVTSIAELCRTIVRVKSGKGRAWVEQLIADPLTDVDVQVALSKMLAADGEAARAAESGKKK